MPEEKPPDQFVEARRKFRAQDGGRDGHGAATVSVAEAAAILGISRGLAYAGVRDGTIPAIRIASRWVVPIPALERMLASAGVESPGDERGRR